MDEDELRARYSREAFEAAVTAADESLAAGGVPIGAAARVWAEDIGELQDRS